MLYAAIAGIAAMLLAIQLKGMKTEYGVYIALGACICILSYGLDRLSTVLSAIGRIQDYVEIPSSYLSIFFKMLGVTYLSEFSAGLCKDGGYQSIASNLEMFGKLSVLAMSTPVILALFDTIERLLTA